MYDLKLCPKHWGLSTVCLFLLQLIYCKKQEYNLYIHKHTSKNLVYQLSLQFHYARETFSRGRQGVGGLEGLGMGGGQDNFIMARLKWAQLTTVGTYAYMSSKKCDNYRCVIMYMFIHYLQNFALYVIKQCC